MTIAHTLIPLSFVLSTAPSEVTSSFLFEVSSAFEEESVPLLSLVPLSLSSLPLTMPFSALSVTSPFSAALLSSLFVPLSALPSVIPLSAYMSVSLSLSLVPLVSDLALLPFVFAAGTTLTASPSASTGSTFAANAENVNSAVAKTSANRIERPFTALLFILFAPLCSSCIARYYYCPSLPAYSLRADYLERYEKISGNFKCAETCK